MRLQKPSEFLAGKLTDLIRVEDLWGATAGNDLRHRVHTEIRGQRIGEPPRSHPASRPVEDRAEIDEAPFHRNIRTIRRPHRIRPSDRQLAQQIGVDPMGRMPLAGPRLPIDRRDAHPPHQCDHLSSPNGMTLLL